MASPIIFSPDSNRVSSLDARINGRCEQVYSSSEDYLVSMLFKKCTEFKWRRLDLNKWTRLSPPPKETRLYQIGSPDRKIFQLDDGTVCRSSIRYCNDCDRNLYFQEKVVQWKKCTGEDINGNIVWSSVTNQSEVPENLRLYRLGAPCVDLLSRKSNPVSPVSKGNSRVNKFEARYQKQMRFFFSCYHEFYVEYKHYIWRALRSDDPLPAIDGYENSDPLKLLQIAHRGNVIFRQMQELDRDQHDFYETYKPTIQKILLLDHPPFQKNNFNSRYHLAIERLDEMYRKNLNAFRENAECDSDLSESEIKAIHHLRYAQEHYSKFYCENREFVDDILKNRKFCFDYELVNPDLEALEYLQNAYREIVVMDQMEELAKYRKNESYVRDVLFLKIPLALPNSSENIEAFNKLEEMYQDNFNELKMMEEFYNRISSSQGELLIS